MHYFLCKCAEALGCISRHTQHSHVFTIYLQREQTKHYNIYLISIYEYIYIYIFLLESFLFSIPHKCVCYVCFLRDACFLSISYCVRFRFFPFECVLTMWGDDAFHTIFWLFSFYAVVLIWFCIHDSCTQVRFSSPSVSFSLSLSWSANLSNDICAFLFSQHTIRLDELKVMQ